jgi:hypothetical protein
MIQIAKVLLPTLNSELPDSGQHPQFPAHPSPQHLDPTEAPAPSAMLGYRHVLTNWAAAGGAR